MAYSNDDWWNNETSVDGTGGLPDPYFKTPAQDADPYFETPTAAAEAAAAAAAAPASALPASAAPVDPYLKPAAVTGSENWWDAAPEAMAPDKALFEEPSPSQVRPTAEIASSPSVDETKGGEGSTLPEAGAPQDYAAELAARTSKIKEQLTATPVNDGSRVFTLEEAQAVKDTRGDYTVGDAGAKLLTSGENTGLKALGIASGSIVAGFAAEGLLEAAAGTAAGLTGAAVALPYVLAAAAILGVGALASWGGKKLAEKFSTEDEEKAALLAAQVRQTTGKYTPEELAAGVQENDKRLVTLAQNESLVESLRHKGWWATAADTTVDMLPFVAEFASIAGASNRIASFALNPRKAAKVYEAASAIVDASKASGKAMKFETAIAQVMGGVAEAVDKGGRIAPSQIGEYAVAIANRSGGKITQEAAFDFLRNFKKPGLLERHLTEALGATIQTGAGITTFNRREFEESKLRWAGKESSGTQKAFLDSVVENWSERMGGLLFDPMLGKVFGGAAVKYGAKVPRAIETIGNGFKFISQKFRVDSPIGEYWEESIGALVRAAMNLDDDGKTSKQTRIFEALTSFVPHNEAQYKMLFSFGVTGLLGASTAAALGAETDMEKAARENTTALLLSHLGSAYSGDAAVVAVNQKEERLLARGTVDLLAKSQDEDKRAWAIQKIADLLNLGDQFRYKKNSPAQIYETTIRGNVEGTSIQEVLTKVEELKKIYKDRGEEAAMDWVIQNITGRTTNAILEARGLAPLTFNLDEESAKQLNDLIKQGEITPRHSSNADLRGLDFTPTGAKLTDVQKAIVATHARVIDKKGATSEESAANIQVMLDNTVSLKRGSNVPRSSVFKTLLRHLTRAGNYQDAGIKATEKTLNQALDLVDSFGKTRNPNSKAGIKGVEVHLAPLAISQNIRGHEELGRGAIYGTNFIDPKTGIAHIFVAAEAETPDIVEEVVELSMKEKGVEAKGVQTVLQSLQLDYGERVEDRLKELENRAQLSEEDQKGVKAIRKMIQAIGDIRERSAPGYDPSAKDNVGPKVNDQQVVEFASSFVTTLLSMNNIDTKSEADSLNGKYFGSKNEASVFAAAFSAMRRLSDVGPEMMVSVADAVNQLIDVNQLDEASLSAYKRFAEAAGQRVGAAAQRRFNESKERRENEKPKEAKPAPKPEAKPVPKPEAKPAPKPEAKPAPKSEAKPAPKPEAKPVEPPVDKKLSDRRDKIAREMFGMGYKPLSAEQKKSVEDAIQRSVAPVEVSSIDELPVHVQTAFNLRKAQGGADASGLDGLYDPVTDTTYILPSGNPAVVKAHEAQHKEVENLDVETRNRLLDKILEVFGNNPFFDQIYTAYKYDKTKLEWRRKAAGEFIAYVLGGGVASVDQSVVDRAAAIKNSFIPAAPVNAEVEEILNAAFNFSARELNPSDRKMPMEEAAFRSRVAGVNLGRSILELIVTGKFRVAYILKNADAMLSEKSLTDKLRKSAGLPEDLVLDGYVIKNAIAATRAALGLSEPGATLKRQFRVLQKRVILHKTVPFEILDALSDAGIYEGVATQLRAASEALDGVIDALEDPEFDGEIKEQVGQEAMDEESMRAAMGMNDAVKALGFSSEFDRVKLWEMLSPFSEHPEADEFRASAIAAMMGTKEEYEQFLATGYPKDAFIDEFLNRLNLNNLGHPNQQGFRQLLVTMNSTYIPLVGHGIFKETDGKVEAVRIADMTSRIAGSLVRTFNERFTTITESPNLLLDTLYYYLQAFNEAKFANQKMVLNTITLEKLGTFGESPYTRIYQFMETLIGVDARDLFKTDQQYKRANPDLLPPTLAAFFIELNPVAQTKGADGRKLIEFNKNSTDRTVQTLSFNPELVNHEMLSKDLDQYSWTDAAAEQYGAFRLAIRQAFHDAVKTGGRGSKSYKEADKKRRDTSNLHEIAQGLAKSGRHISIKKAAGGVVFNAISTSHLTAVAHENGWKLGRVMSISRNDTGTVSATFGSADEAVDVEEFLWSDVAQIMKGEFDGAAEGETYRAWLAPFGEKKDVYTLPRMKMSEAKARDTYTRRLAALFFGKDVKDLTAEDLKAFENPEAYNNLPNAFSWKMFFAHPAYLSTNYDVHHALNILETMLAIHSDRLIEDYKNSSDVVKRRGSDVAAGYSMIKEEYVARTGRDTISAAVVNDPELKALVGKILGQDADAVKAADGLAIGVNEFMDLAADLYGQNITKVGLPHQPTRLNMIKAIVAGPREIFKQSLHRLPSHFDAEDRGMLWQVAQLVERHNKSGIPLDMVVFSSAAKKKGQKSQSIFDTSNPDKVQLIPSVASNKDFTFTSINNFPVEQFKWQLNLQKPPKLKDSVVPRQPIAVAAQNFETRDKYGAAVMQQILGKEEFLKFGFNPEDWPEDFKGVTLEQLISATSSPMLDVARKTNRLDAFGLLDGTVQIAKAIRKALQFRIPLTQAVEVPLGQDTEGVRDFVGRKKNSVGEWVDTPNLKEEGVRMAYAHVQVNVEGLRYNEAQPKVSKSLAAPLAMASLSKIVRKDWVKYLDMFENPELIKTEADAADLKNKVREWEFFKDKTGQWTIPGEPMLIARIPADNMYSTTVVRAGERYIVKEGEVDTYELPNLIRTPLSLQVAAGADFDADKRFILPFVGRGSKRESLDSGWNSVLASMMKDFDKVSNYEIFMNPLDTGLFDDTKNAEGVVTKKGAISKVHDAAATLLNLTPEEVAALETSDPARYRLVKYVQETLGGESLQIGTVEGALALYRSNQVGKRGLGQAAALLYGFNLMESVGVHLQQTVESTGFKGFTFTNPFNGQPATIVAGRTGGAGLGNYVTTTKRLFGTFLNLFADHGKLQKITKLGIDDTNIHLVMSLMFAHGDFKDLDAELDYLTDVVVPFLYTAEAIESQQDQQKLSSVALSASDKSEIWGKESELDAEGNPTSRFEQVQVMARGFQKLNQILRSNFKDSTIAISDYEALNQAVATLLGGENPGQYGAWSVAGEQAIPDIFQPALRGFDMLKAHAYKGTLRESPVWQDVKTRLFETAEEGGKPLIEQPSKSNLETLYDEMHNAVALLSMTDHLRKLAGLHAGANASLALRELAAKTVDELVAVDSEFADNKFFEYVTSGMAERFVIEAPPHSSTGARVEAKNLRDSNNPIMQIGVAPIFRSSPISDAEIERIRSDFNKLPEKAKAVLTLYALYRYGATNYRSFMGSYIQFISTEYRESIHEATADKFKALLNEPWSETQMTWFTDYVQEKLRRNAKDFGVNDPLRKNLLLPVPIKGGAAVQAKAETAGLPDRFESTDTTRTKKVTVFLEGKQWKAQLGTRVVDISEGMANTYWGLSEQSRVEAELTEPAEAETTEAETTEAETTEAETTEAEAPSDVQHSARRYADLPDDIPESITNQIKALIRIPHRAAGKSEAQVGDIQKAQDNLIRWMRFSPDDKMRYLNMAETSIDHLTHYKSGDQFKADMEAFAAPYEVRDEAAHSARTYVSSNRTPSSIKQGISWAAYEKSKASGIPIKTIHGKLNKLRERIEALESDENLDIKAREDATVEAASPYYREFPALRGFVNRYFRDAPNREERYLENRLKGVEPGYIGEPEHRKPFQTEMFESLNPKAAAEVKALLDDKPVPNMQNSSIKLSHSARYSAAAEAIFNDLPDIYGNKSAQEILKMATRSGKAGAAISAIDSQKLRRKLGARLLGYSDTGKKKQDLADRVLESLTVLIEDNGALFAQWTPGNSAEIEAKILEIAEQRDLRLLRDQVKDLQDNPDESEGASTFVPSDSAEKVADVLREYMKSAQYKKHSFVEAGKDVVDTMEKLRKFANAAVGYDWIAPFRYGKDNYLIHQYVYGESLPAEERERLQSEETGRIIERDAQHKTYTEAALNFGHMPKTLNAAELIESWGTSVNQIMQNKILLTGLSRISDSYGNAMIIPARVLGAQEGNVRGSVIPAEDAERTLNSLVNAAQQYAAAYNHKFTWHRDPVDSVWDSLNKLTQHLQGNADGKSLIKALGYETVKVKNTFGLQDQEFFVVKGAPLQAVKHLVEENFEELAADGDKFRYKLLSGLLKINRMIKAVNVGFSFFHHFALMESWLADTGALGVLKATRNVLTARKTYTEMMENSDVALKWIQHGLEITAVPYDTGLNLIDGLIEKMGENFDKNNMPFLGNRVRNLLNLKKGFDHFLWHKMVPVMKIQMAEAAFQGVAKHNADVVDIDIKDMTPAQKKATYEARDDIAKYINDALGAQEWAQYMWATPRVRDVLNTVLFAPDWTISALNIAGAPESIGKMMDKKWLGYESFTNFGSNRRLTHYLPGFMAWVFVAWPAAIQIAIALAYGGGGGGDGDDDDLKLFPFQNEEGKKFSADITPLIHYYQRKRGVPEDQLSRERTYVSPGKQVKEVISWFEDPVRTGFGKLAPPIRMAVTATTGVISPSIYSDKIWESKNEEDKWAKVMASMFPFAGTALLRQKDVGGVVGGLLTTTMPRTTGKTRAALQTDLTGIYRDYLKGKGVQSQNPEMAFDVLQKRLAEKQENYLGKTGSGTAGLWDVANSGALSTLRSDLNVQIKEEYAKPDAKRDAAKIQRLLYAVLLTHKSTKDAYNSLKSSFGSIKKTQSDARDLEMVDRMTSPETLQGLHRDLYGVSAKNNVYPFKLR